VRAEIAMSHAPAQGDYFVELSSHFLVEHVFQWDTAAKLAKKTPGMFGTTRALFYSCEAQGRLTLHHHGIVRLKGIPSTTPEWERLKSDGAVRSPIRCSCAPIPTDTMLVEQSMRKYEEWVKRRWSAELPVLAKLPLPGQCATSTCTLSMLPVHVPPQY